jgi:flavin reductase (DIM6/NTAB) family NADH-FMN oxidoreductase RutF
MVPVHAVKTFLLIKTVDFPRHDIFVGEIVETYCDEQYLTDGVVDFAKIQPILFVMNDRSYWKLGAICQGMEHRETVEESLTT